MRRTSTVVMDTNSSAAVDNRQLEILNYVFKQCLTKWKEGNNRTSRVVNFKTPPDLSALVDFDIGTEPIGIENLKKLCDDAFTYSVNTDHPRFFNQQFIGPDKYGVAGELLVSAMNANAHTYEVAPFIVLTEIATIRKTLKMFGISGGEGTFCPGGSYSAMLAMNLARYKKCPDLKTKGNFGHAPLKVFASKQAHYSASKNAALLGIGTENCVEIDCDESGKMITSELESAVIKAQTNGSVPFLVIATAGTTVLGSFDRFHEIADICKKYNIWMHTDACWGGSVLFSRKHRHLCDGMERSDSIAWNPHKMIQMPIQCSILLSRHEGLFAEVNSTSVPYLFQPDKSYDPAYDLGKRLIQCSKRPDSLKLWLAWKATGDAEYERRVDKAFDNAQYLTELLRNRMHFRLVIPNPEYTNVSFWFIPPSLRGINENEDFWRKLHFVAPAIKAKMQKSGSMLVAYQPVESKVNFFRMIIINPNVTHEDMEFVLDEIEKLGQNL